MGLQLFLKLALRRFRQLVIDVGCDKGGCNRVTWRKWVVFGGFVVMWAGFTPAVRAIENAEAANAVATQSAFDDEDEDDLTPPDSAPAATTPQPATPTATSPAPAATPAAAPPSAAQDSTGSTEAPAEKSDTVPPAATPATAGKPNGLDYLSYFSAENYKTLREACVAWDPKTCLPALEKAHDKETNELQKVRLAFLFAQVCYEGRDFSRALPYLTEVDGRYPLMQDYIHYYMAEIHYWKHDFEKALERFGQVPEESRLKRLARIHATLAAAKLKQPEAKAALEGLVAELKKHPRLPEVLLALAELDLTTDRDLARKRLWRVMKVWPESSYSEQAEERLKTAQLAPLSREEKIRLIVAKAKKLRKRFQYKPAAALLSGVLKDMDTGDRSLLKGTVLYHYARAYFENREYQKALDIYVQIESTEATDFIKGLAIRDRVEAHIKRGENDKAIVLATNLIDAQPSHRKICDVYALLGKAYKENKDFERALDTFSKLADLFPCSQKVLDALWFVGLAQLPQGASRRVKEGFCLDRRLQRRTLRPRASPILVGAHRPQAGRPGRSGRTIPLAGAHVPPDVLLDFGGRTPAPRWRGNARGIQEP